MLGRYNAARGRGLGWAQLLAPIVGGLIQAQEARYSGEIAKSQIKSAIDIERAKAAIAKVQAESAQADLERQQESRRSTRELVLYALGILGFTAASGAYVWWVFKKRRRMAGT